MWLLPNIFEFLTSSDSDSNFMFISQRCFLIPNQKQTFKKWYKLEHVIIAFNLLLIGCIIFVSIFSKHLCSIFYSNYNYCLLYTSKSTYIFFCVTKVKAVIMELVCGCDTKLSNQYMMFTVCSLIMCQIEIWVLYPKQVVMFHGCLTFFELK